MYLDPQIENVVRDGMRREGWRDGQAALINRAADKGGRTRGGITATSWGAYKGLGRLATDFELLAITEDEALSFYATVFVFDTKFDRLTDQKLRALVIDWAFTSGADDPWRAIQSALARRGLEPGPLDGIPGPRTFGALFADRDPRALYRDVLAARVRFYLDLAWDRDVRLFLTANATTALHNCRGWVLRCMDFIP